MDEVCVFSRDYTCTKGGGRITIQKEEVDLYTIMVIATKASLKMQRGVTMAGLTLKSTAEEPFILQIVERLKAYGWMANK